MFNRTFEIYHDQLLKKKEKKDMKCQKCKAEMKKRTGVYGEFLGCTKYPKCKGTQKVVNETVNNENDENTDTDDEFVAS